ncbi:hypothetical protein SELMODRAFT_427196 [Selaginella moellendorffii]|uniref:Synergin gamma C-terminal domain-containing protein n=1 Tax=Selaginella moellendorffii TaxID=88036 RepID=D8SYU2_SELML|nr:hypothetical protein SELMODRAFT_427196 [Selaginella moellendorffii]
MANGFHALWEPPGSAQISQNGGHAKGIHSSSFSSSIRKPLPLSLFGEQDDEDEEGQGKEEEFIAADRGGGGEDGEEEEEEFGEFESVATHIGEQNGNRVEQERIEKSQENGFGDLEAHTPEEKISNGWGSTVPTSELMLAMHGIRSDRQVPLHVPAPSTLLPDLHVPAPSILLPHLQFPAPSTLLPETTSNDDEWGEFAEPSVLKGGGAQVGLVDLISMSDDQESLGKPSTVAKDLFWSPGVEQAFPPSLLDSQQEVLPVDADTAIFSSEIALEKHEQSKLTGWDLDESRWGEKQSTVENSPPDFFLENGNSAGFEHDASLSLLDAQPDVLPVEKDLDAANLITPDGSKLETTVEKDFFWDSSSEVPPSLLDSQQDVPVEIDGFELADDRSWAFSAATLESSGYSRSVSLPAPKADVSFPGDILSGDVTSTGISHRRSHSHGGFHPSFTAIDEWSSFEEFATSIGPRNASPKEIVEEHEEQSLWDTSPALNALQDNALATTNSDLMDLLSLDWDSKAVLAATATDEAQPNAADMEEGMKPKYLKSWTLLARACATELKLGLGIWNDAVSRGCSTRLVSTEQGENYFTALVHIYRVFRLLGASAELYASWLLPGICEELALAMDESRLAWTRLESVVELLDSRTSLTRLEECLRCLPSSPQAPSSPSSCCALSLLRFDSFPASLDVPLVVWDDSTYFLPVANLWANRVSRISPVAYFSG